MNTHPTPPCARVIPITRNNAVYTADETAYALSLSRKTVYTWLRNGTLPGFKSGNRWVIPKRRLEKWVDSLKEATTAEVLTAITDKEKPTR